MLSLEASLIRQSSSQLPPIEEKELPVGRANESSFKANTRTEKKRRNFWWYIYWIFLPLGLVGGPLGLADLFSAVIRWHGWIGFAVAFWDERVSQPFGAVLKEVFQWVHLPSPPEAVVDYLTLSILFLVSIARAVVHMRAYVDDLGDDDTFILGFVMVPTAIVAWPLVLVGMVGSILYAIAEIMRLAISTMFDRLISLLPASAKWSFWKGSKPGAHEQGTAEKAKQSSEYFDTLLRILAMFVLALAPFLLFLGLWWVNSLSEPTF